MNDIDSILRTIFGLEQFRLEQREIVNDVLAGRDALVVMPTGAGKSLCFQLPAVALKRAYAGDFTADLADDRPGAATAGVTDSGADAVERAELG